MNTYHQLVISLNSHHDVFIDLIFSLGVEAIEEKNNTIIVRSSDDLDHVAFGAQELAKSLLASGIDVGLLLEQDIRQNKDWIDEYKKSINPILVDDIYIHTSWQPPLDGKTNIIIDPALAFGSGHHETTFSCLQLLQKHISAGASMLDVGCGSGILSIAAAKLGAIVDACDTDELATKSLQANSKLNQITLNRAWVGSISTIDIKYDIVVANIIADVIMMLQFELVKSLKPGGTLILSGILNKYANTIKDAFKDLILVEELIKNDWISLVYKIK